MDFSDPTVKSLPPNAAARYVNISLIGQGGMGAVLRAYDSLLKRDVALKIIRSHLCEDRRIKRRFRREVQSLASVKHPNIVRFYDFEEEAGVAYFTMEYVEGESLSSLIADGALTKRRSVELVLKLASGLHSVHEAGMLHRDIKPENVVVTAEGELKLIDFGLVKFTDKTNVTALTKQREFVGTLRYLPPEVLGGGEVDAKSDVYQVGLVLYEAIAGIHPLEGQSINALAEGTAYEEIRSIDEVVPGVDADLQKLISSTLAKERDERMASLAELVSGLQKWLDRGKRANTRTIDTGSGDGVVAIDRAAILQGLKKKPKKKIPKKKHDETLIESAVSSQKWQMPKALRNLLIVGAVGIVAIVFSLFREPSVKTPLMTKPVITKAATPTPTIAPSPSIAPKATPLPKDPLALALLTAKRIKPAPLRMANLVIQARKYSRQNVSEIVLTLLKEAVSVTKEVSSGYTVIEETAVISSYYALEGKDKEAIALLQGLDEKAQSLTSPWYRPAALAVVGGAYGFTSAREKSDDLLAKAHKGALDYAVAFPPDKAESLIVQVAVNYGRARRVEAALQLLQTVNDRSKRYEAFKKLTKACCEVRDFVGAQKAAAGFDVKHALASALIEVCKGQEKEGVTTESVREQVNLLLKPLRPSFRVATLWASLAERDFKAEDYGRAEESLRAALAVGASLPAIYEKGKVLSQAARVARKMGQEEWAKGLVKDARTCAAQKGKRRGSLSRSALLRHLVETLGVIGDIEGAFALAKQVPGGELQQETLLAVVKAACKKGELAIVDTVADKFKGPRKLAAARIHLYGAHRRAGHSALAEKAFMSVFSACKGISLVTLRSKAYLALCKKACELGDISYAIRAMAKIVVTADRLTALVLIAVWQQKEAVTLTAGDKKLLQKLAKALVK